MKEKILEALKTKYSHLGFGQKAFDGVAAYLEKTVADETQLETAVAGVEPLLKAFQSDIDKMRTEKSALQVQVEELKKQHAANGGRQDKDDEPAPPFDVEAFKVDLLKTIREEQTAAMQQAQQVAQRNADIAAKAKQFGIPEKFTARLNITPDADLDEFFKNARQELSDAGFGMSEPPVQGGGMVDDGHDIAKLINAGTEQIVKSQKQ